MKRIHNGYVECDACGVASDMILGLDAWNCLCKLIEEVSK